MGRYGFSSVFPVCKVSFVVLLQADLSLMVMGKMMFQKMYLIQDLALANSAPVSPLLHHSTSVVLSVLANLGLVYASHMLTKLTVSFEKGSLI